MTPYTVRTYQEHYEIIELADARTNSRIVLCPERGGIATNCALHGRELFYLDETTFLNPSANIRGGNPVLFPICGPLTDGQYEWEGGAYRMKQHGLARLLKWEVASLAADEHEARASLVLRSSSATLEAYPFDFELVFDYVLQDGVLRIEQTYRNTGSKPLPFYAGFHPYFASAHGSIPYQTDGTRIYDCNDGLEKPLPGKFDKDRCIESHVILDPQQPAITFRPYEDLEIRLSYSAAFRHVVLWSVPGKPFICVEPWMAQNYALNTREGLQLIKPGEHMQAAFAIAASTV